MIKITLDTNCIINILDYKSESSTSVEELVELTRYAMEGDVNISVTTRVESDLNNDKDDQRKNELIKRLAMFPVIGTVFRLDVSKLDSGDVLSGEEHAKLENELKQIIFPNLQEVDSHYQNKIYDIDHLVGHFINKRDIFVTEDMAILKRADALKSSPGILVMNPKKCLEYLNLNADKKILIDEFFEKLKQYRDLLLGVQEMNNYQEKQAEFSLLREWMLKKYPIIKDGLLQFKLHMLSVPAGPGQVVYDRRDILGLEKINERIQYMFIDPDIRDEIKTLLGSLTEFEHVYGPPQKIINERFQDILDLLLSYSGYLENKF
jgi:hypothetical protein